MSIKGAGIPAGSYIVNAVGTTITMNQNGTSDEAATELTIDEHIDLEDAPGT